MNASSIFFGVASVLGLGRFRHPGSLTPRKNIEPRYPQKRNL